MQFKAILTYLFFFQLIVNTPFCLFTNCTHVKLLSHILDIVSVFMCHKYLLVINICREFSNNFLHLVVSASHQALSINLLYVVTHLVTKKFKTETIRKF